MIALPNEQIEVRGACEHPDCDGRPATRIASGRDGPDAGPASHAADFDFRKPRAYCDAHGRVVADQGAPEYTVCCSNCGCLEVCN